MADEPTPAITLKIQELRRLFVAREYRFASRLAGIIADDLAALATAIGQPDEPAIDDDCIPRCE